MAAVKDRRGEGIVFRVGRGSKEVLGTFDAKGTAAGAAEGCHSR